MKPNQTMDRNPSPFTVAQQSAIAAGYGSACRDALAGASLWGAIRPTNGDTYAAAQARHCIKHAMFTARSAWSHAMAVAYRTEGWQMQREERTQ